MTPGDMHAETFHIRLFLNLNKILGLESLNEH